MPVFLAILLPILSLLCLWGSHRTNKRRRLIGNLPTSKTQGVFIGLVELKGTAECETPVTSYLSEEHCVHYSYNVSEHWRREVQETYTDHEGKQKTRTRVESGWTTVQQDGESTPFYLQDDTGVVLVRPDGAEVRPRGLFSQSCGPADPLYYGKGPPGAVADSTFTRRFSESGIRLHDQVFVVGQARERQDVVAAELAQDKGVPLYLLTVESEEQYLHSIGWSMHLKNILGLLLAGGAGFALGGIIDRRASPVIGMLIGLGAYAVLWAFTWTVLIYNALIDVRNRMRHGWSTLDVQLKRRHDLIPQVVTILEAGRGYEKDVQEHIAHMRAQLSATPPGQPGPDFRGVAGQVIGLAEKYPDLKVQGAFMQLQAQLIETEQRIALARAYFNDAATAYNTRIEVMPDALLAKLAAFKRQRLLDAEDFERARVDVNLAQ